MRNLTCIILPYSLFLVSYFLFLFPMRPDYAHKLFTDHRSHFSLLMETLAMDRN